MGSFEKLTALVNSMITRLDELYAKESLTEYEIGECTALVDLLEATQVYRVGIDLGLSFDIEKKYDLGALK